MRLRSFQPSGRPSEPPRLPAPWPSARLCPGTAHHGCLSRCPLAVCSRRDHAPPRGDPPRSPAPRRSRQITDRPAASRPKGRRCWWTRERPRRHERRACVLACVPASVRPVCALRTGRAADATAHAPPPSLGPARRLPEGGPRLGCEKQSPAVIGA